MLEKPAGLLLCRECFLAERHALELLRYKMHKSIGGPGELSIVLAKAWKDFQG